MKSIIIMTDYDGSGLTAPARHEFILERVAERRHVAVRDLARELEVSEATVRRDLKSLAESNRLELVYGGATLRSASDQSLEARARLNTEAKRVIGDLAGELVRDHQTIFVDSGTTCFEMRRHLARRENLTVIANSTRLAIELSRNPSTNLLLLAGQYRAERMDTVGPLAVATIDQLRGFTAFIGADGLDPSFGISASEMQTAHLYQHVIRNARETILLADHSKFASSSLFRIGDFDAVSTVVTDRPLAPEWADYFAARDIAVVTPTHA